MNAVIRHLEKDSLNRSDFQIVHLVFRNGLPDKEIEDYTGVRSNKSDGVKNEPYKRITYASEATVPVNGIANAAFAHPNRELAEAEFIADRTLYFDLERTKISIPDLDEPFTPIIPLSRHLSDYSRLSMHKCINNIINEQALKDSLN